MIAKLLTQTGITVFVKGNPPFTMARSHKSFANLLKAIETGDEKKVLNVIQIANQASKFMDGQVKIIDGEVFYGAENVHGVLVDRILESMEEGLDNKHLIKFLENLMQNPSKQSREELYLFLEACGDLPISDDGRFIAYKWVQDNYRDVHSGKFDNSVGQVVKMARRDVNDDRRVTCSTGLHVCSSKYSKFGARLMLVAVNPKDVVSVPNDYDNGKMRVCEYEVVDEVQQADYCGFQSRRYAQ